MQPAGCVEDGGPASMVTVDASTLYPLKALSPGSDTSLTAPFPTLPGESIEYLGRTSDGIIALSNFRLLMKLRSATIVNIPLALIDTIECRDIFFLYVYCKDARSHRCTFSTNEACMDWYKRLSVALNPPSSLKDVFAFAFHVWCQSEMNNGTDNCLVKPSEPAYSFDREVERLGFNFKNEWRLCYLNEDYKLSPTYPKVHIMPNNYPDDDLKAVAQFRSSRRFPSVVWRDQKTGAVIVRSSQPEVGWLGWRSPQDENLLQAIAASCSQTGPDAIKSQEKIPNGHVGTQTTENGVDDETGELAEENVKKVLIIDARSYTAAVANRAKGGGCECPEYYQNCEIQFMSLANIHSIRKSFQALRTLCVSPPDQTSWLSTLETSKWLQHIAGLMRAAVIVVNAVSVEARPVLVHCSDGWDRTPQITALAQIMLDPYYRTIEGFQVLIEREWLAYGHKFADRCALGVYSDDTNERCPVFLQFLDCVQQLLKQFPTAFQFNEAFLVKLVQHTYSCLFGTFLCNSASDREAVALSQETDSVWSLLRLGNPKFRNYIYTPNGHQVLRPSCHVRNFNFWLTVYLSEDVAGTNDTSLEDDTVESAPSEGSQETEPCTDSSLTLTKTRSCDDIAAAIADASSHPTPMTRRLSDPNLMGESPPSSASSALEAEMQLAAEIKDLLLPKNNYLESVQYDTREESVKFAHMNGVTLDSEDCAVDEASRSSTGTGGVIEASTDTLTGELFLEADNALNRNGSELTLLEEDGHIEETDSKHMTNKVASGSSLDCTSSIDRGVSRSTSTSELSCPSINNNLQHRMVHSGARLINPGTALSLYIPESAVHMSAMSGVSCRAGSEPLVNGHVGSSVESESCSPAQHTHTPTSPTPANERCIWSGRGVTSSWRQQLDCDGLVTWVDAGQMRLAQMEAEYMQRIEQLQRQLHLARLQATYYHGTATRNSVHTKEETGSQGAESIESTSTSAGGSDLSWEQVEERDAQMTLWVPDHAVTHCAGCEREFWIVRRKHHCRNCGQVFCGECTGFSIEVPAQQLTEPVRVCNSCFNSLEKTGNGEIVDMAASAFTTLTDHDLPPRPDSSLPDVHQRSNATLERTLTPTAT